MERWFLRLSECVGALTEVRTELKPERQKQSSCLLWRKSACPCPALWLVYVTDLIIKNTKSKRVLLCLSSQDQDVWLNTAECH